MEAGYIIGWILTLKNTMTTYIGTQQGTYQHNKSLKNDALEQRAS
jgi:hypothetical protein